MAQTIDRLPDAELLVMQAVWEENAPCTRLQLEERLAGQGWAKTTLLSLLSRLESRGFIAREKQGKGFLYRAVIPKEDYLSQESGGILQRVFDGSVKQFVAALWAGDALSKQDISELEDYLHQLQKGE